MARWHSIDDVLPVCTLRLGTQISVVVGVPMTPTDLLSDQQRAVDHMVEAVALAGPSARSGSVASAQWSVGRERRLRIDWMFR